MEENRNDIEILKAMIKDNFEEQRKLIAKLETALEAVTSFNGKQISGPNDSHFAVKKDGGDFDQFLKLLRERVNTPVAPK